MKVALSKSLLFRSWLVSLPVFVVLWYFPYIDFPIRVVTWVIAFLFLMGAIYFSWTIRILRWLLITIYGLIGLFLVWPSHHSVDRPALQTDYCTALKSYLGCRYVWGGEGYLGIDCSGLVQKGLIDALATRGFTTLNPSLMRDSLSLYWHRTNAKVLGEGYAGRTDIVTTCPTLNALDYSLVKPGDLAVTAGGDHVMAYLGNQTWI